MNDLQFDLPNIGSISSYEQTYSNHRANACKAIKHVHRNE